MYSNCWNVKAKLAGSFYLAQIQNLNLEVVPHIPELRRLRLDPEADAQDRLTGNHLVEIELEVVPSVDTNLFGNVLDVAKGAVFSIAARLSVASGQRVDVLPELIVTQLGSDDSGRGRSISTAQGADLTPPTKIPGEFAMLAANPSLERAMHWWSHALRISDPADSLHALFVALDLIASSEKPPSSRKRRCKKCGHTEILQPGLREKVIHLLTKRGRLSQTLAEEIYNTRTGFTHGSVAVTEEKRRVFRQHAAHVRTIVRNEFSSRMNCALPPLPESLHVDVHSAYVVVEFGSDKPNDSGNTT